MPYKLIHISNKDKVRLRHIKHQTLAHHKLTMISLTKSGIIVKRIVEHIIIL